MSPFEIRELLNLVIENINDGATYKTTRLVCHKWLKICEDHHYKVAQFSNHLWTLITKFPAKFWNWQNLGANINTDISCIKWYPEILKYDYFLIGFTINPNITEKIMEQNPDIQFNKHVKGYNPNNAIINFSHDMIYHSKCNVNDIKLYCENPTVVSTYGTYLFSRNINITWNDVLKNPYIPWNWGGLSENPNITLDIIEQNSQSNWDEYYLSRNPNLTFQFVKKYSIKQKWDWHILTIHPGITWEDIQAEPFAPWVYNRICRNPNITLKIIEEWLTNPLLEHLVDWSELSLNPNLTWEFVIKYENKKWNWNRLSDNLFNRYNPKLAKISL